MKKIKYFFVGPILLALIVFSCKKEAAKPPLTVVEYQVTPMNDFVTRIWYHDSSGNNLIVPDPSISPSPFANGTKSFHILSKPYKARIEVDFFNKDPIYPHSWNMKILVDGDIRKDTTCVCLARYPGIATIEYTVQQ